MSQPPLFPAAGGVQARLASAGDGAAAPVRTSRPHRAELSPQVLIAESDEAVHRALRPLLEREGLACRSVLTWGEAATSCARERALAATDGREPPACSPGLEALGSLPTSKTRQTVLVVEDDDLLRRFIHLVLEGAGYCVLSPERVEAALSLAEHHPGPIALVLTDLNMPRMSGPEVARRIRVLRPAVRLLYITGAAPELIRDQQLLPQAPLLGKPFTAKELLATVREVLGESGS
jgi:CheY-like chemotaxis protein